MGEPAKASSGLLIRWFVGHTLHAVSYLPKEKTVEKSELFEKVRNHLLEQGRRAADEKGDCLYRGPDGTKCAVGCIIPDDLYDPDMEDCSAFEVKHGAEDVAKIRRIWKAVEDRLDLTEENKSLLQRFQRIHDQVPADEWEVALKALRLWELGY